MDILKKEKFKTKEIVFAILLFLMPGINSDAQTKQPVQVLMDSYKLPDKLTSEIAEKAVSELNNALNQCTDEQLKFTIKYRIGILYFKANDFTKAIGCFESISGASGCPDIVRLCSLNMTGQIYRMQAKDDKALIAFDDLIKLSQKYLKKDSIQENPESVLRLAAAAGFGRAEIFQYNQDYNSAIAEYEKIVAFIKSQKESNIKSYAPLALDKISQLYLLNKKVEDYKQKANNIVEDYNDYYRTGIIKLEIEAVKILKEKENSINFPKGSFEASARLIELVRDSNDKELKNKVSLLCKDLSNQYRQSYSGIVLGYYYGWLLDVLGSKKEAVSILKDICNQDAVESSNIADLAKIIRMLTDYAKLQQATILSEDNKFKEALVIAGSIKPDPNDAHILDLADSIKKGLEILKREVKEDVNNK